MLFNHRGMRVFLYQRVIDMRSGFEQLSHFVRVEMGSDLLTGHLYLFLGKNRKRAKVIYFDGTGLVLVHKRLETGRFMRVDELANLREMTVSELSLILDGSVVRQRIAAAAYA